MENDFIRIIGKQFKYQKRRFFFKNGFFIDCIIFKYPELSIKKYMQLKECYTILFAKHKSYLKDEIHYLYTDSYFIKNPKIFILINKNLKDVFIESFYEVVI